MKIVATVLASILFHSSIFASVILCDLEDAGSYELLRNNSEALEQAISQLLLKAGYVHDSKALKVMPKRNLVACDIVTDKGRKFLKLHKKGMGYREYLGTCLFKDIASTIPSEHVILSNNVDLLIQPYIQSAENDGGMLYDMICEAEFDKQKAPWALLNGLFCDMLEINRITMDYCIKQVRNDRLFFDRLQTKANDGLSGRIEIENENKQFQLQDTVVSWNELKDLHWKVDGVSYRETLGVLLEQARAVLDPKKPRLVGICHGDWHEMNIAVNGVNHAGAAFPYAYLDLELAGENDLFADAMVYLTYTAIFGDYFTPKYFPSQFEGKKWPFKAFERSKSLKTDTCVVSRKGDQISVDNFSSFGTLPIRKEAIALFFNSYLLPLIDLVKSRFGVQLNTAIQEHLKAAYITRLIGVYPIADMSSQDQVKIFSLLFAVVGTPENGDYHEEICTRILKAL